MAERLYEKFRVERTDPEAQERHKDCWMFVLDPEHDPVARIALAAYATAAVKADLLGIAADLRLKMRDEGWS